MPTVRELALSLSKGDNHPLRGADRGPIPCDDPVEHASGRSRYDNSQTSGPEQVKTQQVLDKSMPIPYEREFSTKWLRQRVKSQSKEVRDGSARQAFRKFPWRS